MWVTHRNSMVNHLSHQINKNSKYILPPEISGSGTIAEKTLRILEG